MATDENSILITCGRNQRPLCPEVVGLLVVVEQAQVVPPQDEGSTGGGGRELERRNHFAPLLLLDHLLPPVTDTE